MVKKIYCDDEIEAHINNVMAELQGIGLKNVSKPMALRAIIQMNKAAHLKMKRKRKSKVGLLFL